MGVRVKEHKPTRLRDCEQIYIVNIIGLLYCPRVDTIFLATVPLDMSVNKCFLEM